MGLNSPASYAHSSFAHGIMFHHFHGGVHPKGQGSLSAEDFHRLLDFIGPDRILTPSEFTQRAKIGGLQPTDLCLTFDDNLRCQYDIALPVLEERNLKAFWFVYTSVLDGELERLEIYRHFRSTAFPCVDAFYTAFLDNVRKSRFHQTVEHALLGFQPDKFLKEFPFYTVQDKVFRYLRDEVLGPKRYFQVMDEMIRVAKFKVRPEQLWMDGGCLKRLRTLGHSVGLHSHTHPTRLAELPPLNQEKEFILNAQKIREATGHPAIAASFPCNSYNEHTLDTVKKLGIEISFRANLSHGPGNVFEIPREDHANVMAQMKGRA